MDDEALGRLLIQARNGNEQALNALFGELRDRLCGRAWGFLGPAAAARLDGSDVAQYRVEQVP